MGDTDASRALDGSTVAAQTRVRAGLTAAYAYGDQVWGLDKSVVNYENLKIRLQMLLFTAAVDLPGGAGAAIALPSGRVRTTTDSKFTDDSGIGDLEVRLRQDVFKFFGVTGSNLPRVSVATGVGMPTGGYVSRLDLKKSEDTGQKLDKSLSLGRGVWWLFGDVDVFGKISDRFGYYAALRTKTPLNHAVDEFAWGEEAQSSIGLSAQIVPKLISMSASADYLWRHVSTQLDEYTKERVDSASVGGKYLDTTLSVRGQVTDNIAVDLSGRKPLWRNVLGLQTLPNYWVFVGVNWNMRLGEPVVPPKPVLRAAQAGDAAVPEIAALLPAGKVALVDYWATWCAPCLKLSKELEEYAAAHPALHIVKVDATDWDQPHMDSALPAVAGLPVVDVYGSDGRLVQRLVGTEAFDYAKFLPSEATAVTK